MFELSGNHRRNRAAKISHGAGAESGRRSDRNRSDGIPGARYSTRSRSSQRDSLYRSDELGGQNKFIEQAQATAKRNAARRETSTTRGSRNHALISLTSILPPEGEEAKRRTCRIKDG